MCMHILVTVLMVLAAFLQFVILRDPASPNLRAIGAFRWCVMAGYTGMALRLLQMGMNHYEPPVSPLGLVCLGLMAVGHIGMQLDRLGFFRRQPPAVEKLLHPTP